VPQNPTEKRADQHVPLVIYKGGQRIVVGQAIVKGDGQIEAQISKDARKDLGDLFFKVLIGDISINPARPRPKIVNDPLTQDLGPLKSQEP
jgi:hypothetical protein